MLKAKDFFGSATDDWNYDIHVNGQWYANITRDQMRIELDRIAFLYEEDYAVSFFAPSMINERIIYVTLEETHNRADTGFELAKALDRLTEK